MIRLTFEQKKDIGLKFLLDSMEPATPFGAEKLKKIEAYDESGKQQLENELDNIEKILAEIESNRDGIDRLVHSMSVLRDVRTSIKNCADGYLDEVELFQLNAFLIQLSKVLPQIRALECFAELKDISLTDVELPLAVLDPGGSGRLSFYIEDTRTPELLQIRKEKREVERKLNSLPKNQRQELNIKRMEICRREEEQLSLIHRDMSVKLRPYLSSLLANAETIGKLDLVIQKAFLARRFGGTRPVVGAETLVLSDGINPEIRERLQQNKRDFTPISIKMERGVTVLTGANMGGKSVALKTLVLNISLAHMGFYAFAGHCRMPFFDSLELINKDFESVSSGLSNFGGDISRFNAAVANISSDKLIFMAMDEFARGTNAQEGAAIARGVVKYLSDKNVFTLFTTHYDGAAEYAGAHYQVVGLRNFDYEEAVRQHDLSGEGGVKLIGEKMDYGLFLVDKDTPCPRDAVNICRLLGMERDILESIE